MKQSVLFVFIAVVAANGSLYAEFFTAEDMVCRAYLANRLEIETKLAEWEAKKNAQANTEAAVTQACLNAGSTYPMWAGHDSFCSKSLIDATDQEPAKVCVTCADRLDGYCMFVGGP